MLLHFIVIIRRGVMIRKTVIVFLLSVFMGTPALAIDWETNPVFLRGVGENSIFASYRATFGSGRLHNISNSITGKYATYLVADRDIVSHGLYTGYVHILSPESNFGTFASYNLGLEYTEGFFHQRYPATGNYYVDDYGKYSRKSGESLDLLYTRKLSTKLALGASLNLDRIESRKEILYSTLSTNRSGRYAEYIDKKEKYYIGATFGLGWLPSKDLELDFALEAAGLFGNLRYEEDIVNYPMNRSYYDFRDNGTIAGWKIRAEVDGIWKPSKHLRIPFSLSYAFNNELEEYSGFGIYDRDIIPQSLLYFKDYENDFRAHAMKVGVGLKYYPTGKTDEFDLYLWCYYKYYNGTTRTVSIIDETNAGLPLIINNSNVTYNNNSVGFSVGGNLPLTEHLMLSMGLNYYYTFVFMNQRQRNYADGNTSSIYNYSGDGHSQYLGLKLGLGYDVANSGLSINLTSHIPILHESSYVLDGANNANLFLPDPIRSDSVRRDYSVILSITYSF